MREHSWAAAPLFEPSLDSIADAAHIAIESCNAAFDSSASLEAAPVAIADAVSIDPTESRNAAIDSGTSFEAAPAAITDAAFVDSIELRHAAFDSTSPAKLHLFEAAPAAIWPTLVLQAPSN